MKIGNVNDLGAMVGKTGSNLRGINSEINQKKRELSQIKNKLVKDADDQQKLKKLQMELTKLEQKKVAEEKGKENETKKAQENQQVNQTVDEQGHFDATVDGVEPVQASVISAEGNKIDEQI